MSGNLISLVVAPSLVVSAAIAFFNVALRQLKATTPEDEQEVMKEEEQQLFISLMAEPPPTSTRVVEQMKQAQTKLISNGRPPLDRDVAFVMGEAEMPLTVYESPLMVAYRKFQEMKRDDKSDGYYIVQRKQITNDKENSEKRMKRRNLNQNRASLDQSINQLFEDEDDQQEILLLYGRGPIFKMNDDYSDRYLGFDD
ncbi:hypothetical protein C9374_004868 [Naegleria lovaniensis]|uniref:Uncharacterized protein n=1 Tax=Naegleria lovaniensis TaxID=51637 RepID=A0AA88GPI2_NAELO|nr:uncharacterized protein C9374_004868 [Naegleria lovaniensis]KAG2382901.1 hypothetical protein C9374_004868 [Naegleria lovaniensis]